MASVVAGPIVHEADQLEAELAVLEDAVGHHPAEIADADDEHALAGRCPRASGGAAGRARPRATRT